MYVRLVLDTSAVRAHVHEGRLPIDLLRERHADVRVSLTDFTWTELLLALLRGGIPWAEWAVARADINSTLDPELPIILGCVDLCHRAGAIRPEEGDQTDNSWRAKFMWYRLRDAESVQDLSSEVRVRTPDGRIVTVALVDDPESLAREIRQARWVEPVESWRDQVRVAMGSGEGAPPLADQSRVDGVASSVQSVYAERAPGSGPNAERLAAPARFLALMQCNSVRSSRPYDPRSDKNQSDYVDWMQLWILMLANAVLCTEDARLSRRLEAAGVDRATVARVVSICELRARLLDGTLSELVASED